MHKILLQRANELRNETFRKRHTSGSFAKGKRMLRFFIRNTGTTDSYIIYTY